MDLKSITFSLAATALCISTATAAPLIQYGNVPQDDSNLVVNPCQLDDESIPNLELACLNDDHGMVVKLTSDEPLIATGGQASIESTDGLFSGLNISFLDGSYIATLILNIDAVKSKPSATVRFELGIPDAPAYSSPLFNLDSNGENFFTITGGPFSYVAFNTYVGAPQTSDVVEDVKQVRIGSESASIPAPGSLALLGLGLVGLAVTRRRTTSR